MKQAQLNTFLTVHGVVKYVFVLQFNYLHKFSCFQPVKALFWALRNTLICKVLRLIFEIRFHFFQFSG